MYAAATSGGLEHGCITGTRTTHEHTHYGRNHVLKEGGLLITFFLTQFSSHCFHFFFLSLLLLYFFPFPSPMQLRSLGKRC